MVIKIQGFWNRDQNPCYYFRVAHFDGKFMQDAEGFFSHSFQILPVFSTQKTHPLYQVCFAFVFLMRILLSLARWTIAGSKEFSICIYFSTDFFIRKAKIIVEISRYSLIKSFKRYSAFCVSSDYQLDYLSL